MRSRGSTTARVSISRARNRRPRSLFDSVADNLIGNALMKRASERDTRVKVTLACNEQLVLRVSDTGSAVPPEIEARLLRAPVSSRGGLGIGLYQAARQAEAAGFQLALEANVDGQVSFSLTGPPG
jgi:sensor histidine kinase regulating citrate/malate metabolism